MKYLAVSGRGIRDLLLLYKDKLSAKGIGKPEPLKFDMSGLWSRRIKQEHRLIYQVMNS